MPTRRVFLKSGGLALAGFGLAGALPGVLQGLAHARSLNRSASMSFATPPALVRTSPTIPPSASPAPRRMASPSTPTSP